MNLSTWLYRLHSQTIQTVFLTKEKKKQNKLPCETILSHFFKCFLLTKSSIVEIKITHLVCYLQSTGYCSKKQQSFTKWNWLNRFLGFIWSNSQYELYICLIYDSSSKSGPWQILLRALALCRYTSRIIGTKWLFRKWAVSLFLSQEGKHPLQSGHRLWRVDPGQVTMWIISRALVATWLGEFGHSLCAPAQQSWKPPN